MSVPNYKFSVEHFAEKCPELMDLIPEGYEGLVGIFVTCPQLGRPARHAVMVWKRFSYSRVGRCSDAQLDSLTR